MPFFKVTLVFQRRFLTWSLMECLNSDFKESAHGRWAGVAAPSAGCPEVWGLPWSTPPAVESTQGPVGAGKRANIWPWGVAQRKPRSVPRRRSRAGRWVLEAPPTFLRGALSPRSRRFAGAELLRLSVQTSKLTALRFGGASCPRERTLGVGRSLCAGATAAGQAAWPWCWSRGQLFPRGEEQGAE